MDSPLWPVRGKNTAHTRDTPFPFPRRLAQNPSPTNPLHSTPFLRFSRQKPSEQIRPPCPRPPAPDHRRRPWSASPQASPSLRQCPEHLTGPAPYPTHRAPPPRRGSRPGRGRGRRRRRGSSWSRGTRPRTRATGRRMRRRSEAAGGEGGTAGPTLTPTPPLTLNESSTSRVPSILWSRHYKFTCYRVRLGLFTLWDASLC